MNTKPHGVWCIESCPPGSDRGWNPSTVVFSVKDATGQQTWFDTLAEAMWAWEVATSEGQYDHEWLFRIANSETGRYIFLGRPPRKWAP